MEIGLIERHDGRVERERGAAGLHGDAIILFALVIGGPELKPRIPPPTRLRSSDESTLRRDVTIRAMQINELGDSLVRLFSELVDGAPDRGDAFMLNSGDPGLLRCLDRLSAAEASQSTDGGATIAAHAQHVRYGLSLMNQWAAEGGNPFANATWDAAWRVSTVDAAGWDEIRSGLRAEAHGWLEALNATRELRPVELTGMISSVAHLAYHLGAIRQINKSLRGPKEGAFAPESGQPST